MLRNLKLKIFIVLIIILTQSIFVLSCANAESIDLANSKPQYMGNTIGNLLNLGIIANDDNSIYFMSSEGTQVILNKSTNGELQEIGNELCFFLNVVDDFIYYVNTSDDTIHRMDTNGSNSERLGDIKADFIFVIYDTLYALGGETDISSSNLYAMNIDGSDTRILSSDRVNQMYFYNNKVYYATYVDGQVLLYRMNMDGENKELIIPDQTGENTQGVKSLNWFCVYDENIYYLTFGGMKEIRKFDTEKKEDSLVYEINNEILLGCINIADDTIYFLTPGAPILYTWINLNTGEWKTSSHKASNNIGMYTIGNKVVYYSHEQPFTMNIDGSGKRRLN